MIRYAEAISMAAEAQITPEELVLLIRGASQAHKG